MHDEPVSFYEIEFPLQDLVADAVETLLFELGAASITFLDRGDEPVLEPLPGEIRLWSDTLVRALFQTSHAEGHAERDVPVQVLGHLDRLAAHLGPHITSTARVRAVPDRDWERAWLAGWKSMRFGRRLWICPTVTGVAAGVAASGVAASDAAGDAASAASGVAAGAAAPTDAPADPEAAIVRLDPGLAFGTGTHPTTALCLQILDSLPLIGRTVIDYGCGSGILGIAALKLGAAHVIAVDLDPQALLATRDNAMRNGVSSRIDIQGVPARLRPADCVVANILAQPLIELAPLLTDACSAGGDLLLSGLLKTQAYAVKAAYASGFDRLDVIGLGDWCCIQARRNG